ncbi:MAG: hypothetical protein Q9219_005689 [cf. Caloplaca sp. 3 TL-2023]
MRGHAHNIPPLEGAIQESVNYPAKWCYVLPGYLQLGSAILLEPLSEAIHAGERALIKPGMSVLVIGASVIGLLCAALCTAWQSKSVVIADSQEDRLRFALEERFATRGKLISSLVASDIVDKLTFAVDMSQRIAAPEKPAARFDVVFECTGSEPYLQTAIYNCRPGGKVVIVRADDDPQMIFLPAARDREVDIIGAFSHPIGFAPAIDVLTRLTRQYHGLPDLSTLATHWFKGLANAPAAFQQATQACDRRGKPVFKTMIIMDSQGGSDPSKRLPHPPSDNRKLPELRASAQN